MTPAADARAYRRALWLVAAAACCVRLGAALALDGLRHPRLSEYDAIARRLLAGQGFSYEHLDVVYYSFNAPLPSWVNAASYWVSDSLVPAMLLQIALGVAMSVVTAAIAWRLFEDRFAALAAGLLAAVHPGLTLYAAAQSHSLAYDAFFFTAAVLLLLRLEDRPTLGRAAAFGAVVGIGAYSRATVVVILPIGAVWLLWRASADSRRTAAVCGLAAGLCAAMVIAPWSIRNSLLHHRFVFMLTTDSEVFWRGNNPYASGTSYIDADHLVIDALPPDEIRDLHRQPGELAQAEWFRTRAEAFIREHPGAFVELTLRKLFYFWWFSPQTGITYPRRWAQLYMAYYAAAVVLAVVGARAAMRGPRGRATLAVVVAFLLVTSVLQSLYYVEGRHRWEVEPLLLAIAGGGAAVVRAYNGRFAKSS